MKSETWDIVTSQYGVGLQSEFDISLGVREIIKKLRNSDSDLNTGNNLDLTFYEPPLSYIYVNNKTVGGSGHLTAFTECEFTFYQNDDNTVRLRYFIQVTHDKPIHGISWVKASHNIPHDANAVKRVMDYVKENFLNNESDSTVSEVKSTYGVWDGKGRRIGTMYNIVVRGFEESTRMNDKSIAKIVSLMHNAVSFFRVNQPTINNLITQQNP